MRGDLSGSARLRHALLVTGVGLACCATQARAQADYGASVTARERSRVEDSSVRVGGFLVAPQVSARASYNDNIFATDILKRDDVYFSIRPDVNIRSTWSRNSLVADAYYQRDIYSKYSSENASNYGLSAIGRYDISGQTRAFLSAAIDRNTERRGSLSSFFNTAEPVSFTSITTSAALEQDLGNLKLRGEGRLRRVTYGAATLANGTRLDEGFRDLTIYGGSLQANYDLNTITQFVLRGTLEARRYDIRTGEPGFDPITQIDRSGDSTLVEAGIKREITRLLLGEIRIGYLNFRYPDTKLNDLSAFSYYGNLRWNVTPLTTVALTGQRRVDETTSPLTAGNLRDEISLNVDHELLRTLILTGRARFAWIDPSARTGVPSTLTTSSREREFSLESRYYIGRHIRVEGGYTYSARSSANRFIAFRQNILSLGLNYMW